MAVLSLLVQRADRLGPGSPRAGGDEPPPPRLAPLRVAYAGSVVLLVVLALATLASPLILPAMRREQAPLPEAGKLQLLAKPGEWVLQYNLVNKTAASGAYTFELTTVQDASRNVLHTANVFVDAGRPYVFIYHLRADQVPGGTVQFTVRRGGDGAPLEDLTLHLSPRGDKR